MSPTRRHDPEDTVSHLRFALKPSGTHAANAAHAQRTFVLEVRHTLQLTRVAGLRCSLLPTTWTWGCSLLSTTSSLYICMNAAHAQRTFVLAVRHTLQLHCNA